jgi:hypothetical protein
MTPVSDIPHVSSPTILVCPHSAGCLVSPFGINCPNKTFLWIATYTVDPPLHLLTHIVVM